MVFGTPFLAISIGVALSDLLRWNICLHSALEMVFIILMVLWFLNCFVDLRLTVRLLGFYITWFALISQSNEDF